MKLSTADNADRQNFFKVDTVDIDVKNFNIKLKQSKYKLLFGLAKPVMLKVLRPVFQKVLEKQIKDQVHQLDTFLYQIQQEVNRVQDEVSLISILLDGFERFDFLGLDTPEELSSSVCWCSACPHRSSRLKPFTNSFLLP